MCRRKRRGIRRGVQRLRCHAAKIRREVGGWRSVQRVRVEARYEGVGRRYETGTRHEGVTWHEIGTRHERGTWHEGVGMRYNGGTWYNRGTRHEGVGQRR